MKTLYRAEDSLQDGGMVDIWIREFEVISSTRCGYWVKDSRRRSGKRFVYAQSSRFAFATITDALDNYRRRKAREMEICIAKLRKAKTALDTVRLLIDMGAKPEKDWAGQMLRAPDEATNMRDVIVDVRV